MKIVSMRPKIILITRAQKLIYGWLIFCVGGLAPLTFSTPLSPHRDVPVVNIALFDSPRHFLSTPANPAPSVKRIWKLQRFNARAKIHSFESFTPNLVQFFQSNVSSGYLLTTAHAYLIFQASLVGFIALYSLIGRSASLPPLEKPPQSLLT